MEIIYMAIGIVFGGWIDSLKNFFFQPELTLTALQKQIINMNEYSVPTLSRVLNFAD
jgi:hypothetical protein